MYGKVGNLGNEVEHGKARGGGGGGKATKFYGGGNSQTTQFAETYDLKDAASGYDSTKDTIFDMGAAKLN